MMRKLSFLFPCIRTSRSSVSLFSISTHVSNSSGGRVTESDGLTDFLIGARRLITYRRLPEGELSDTTLARKKIDDQGTTADDLNAFRRVVRIIRELMAQ